MQLKQMPRDALLKPLQAVSGIVERRQTLPILANVLLEQKDGRLFVTATDLEMQITAYGEFAGKQDQSITVGARKLQDLLRALPEDAVLNVDTAAGKMTVRAGRSRFNLQTLPAADYPRIGLAQDQLQIICTNSEQEEAEEELEVGYKGEALDIGFNITYLLDVLHNLAADQVVLALGDANSSALITMRERNDYKYVVMPMRI